MPTYFFAVLKILTVTCKYINIKCLNIFKKKVVRIRDYELVSWISTMIFKIKINLLFRWENIMLLSLVQVNWNFFFNKLPSDDFYEELQLYADERNINAY